MKCEDKSKAKQQGGALGGRKATVWVSSSGLQGNGESFGCTERTNLGFTHTSCHLYLVATQTDATVGQGTSWPPSLSTGAGRGLEAFQFFLKAE